MKRYLAGSAVAVLVALGSATAGAQAMAGMQMGQEPYKEGPVVVVSSIRTNPGQTANYMKYLFGDYAKQMNAEKAAGIILDWGVLTVEPRHLDDPDIYLTVTYANMGALDGLNDRVRPLMQKTMNMTPDQAAAGTAARGTMRRLLGSQMTRAMVPR